MPEHLCQFLSDWACSMVLRIILCLYYFFCRSLICGINRILLQVVLGEPSFLIATSCSFSLSSYRTSPLASISVSNMTIGPQDRSRSCPLPWYTSSDTLVLLPSQTYLCISLLSKASFFPHDRDTSIPGKMIMVP